MKEKIEKEMEKSKRKVKWLIKYVRLCVKDMQGYMKEDDFANAKVEVEDAIEVLVWICEELEVLSRLKELLKND